ncbi:MAG: hypothetical protein C0485_03545 [Pirellula sp.]|nr:hypothetical protein [Pirellula sp.]
MFIQSAKTPYILLHMSKYANYQDVPWLRKSGTNTTFLVLHLLTLGILPFLLITCLVLITGDIYYNKTDSDGTLAVWSKANKVIAFLLLLPPLLLIGVVVATITGF